MSSPTTTFALDPASTPTPDAIFNTFEQWVRYHFGRGGMASSGAYLSHTKPLHSTEEVFSLLKQFPLDQAERLVPLFKSAWYFSYSITHPQRLDLMKTLSETKLLWAIPRLATHMMQAPFFYQMISDSLQTPQSFGDALIQQPEFWASYVNAFEFNNPLFKSAFFSYTDSPDTPDWSWQFLQHPGSVALSQNRAFIFKMALESGAFHGLKPKDQSALLAHFILFGSLSQIQTLKSEGFDLQALPPSRASDLLLGLCSLSFPHQFLLECRSQRDLTVVKKRDLARLKQEEILEKTLRWQHALDLGLPALDFTNTFKTSFSYFEEETGTLKKGITQAAFAPLLLEAQRGGALTHHALSLWGALCMSLPWPETLKPASTLSQNPTQIALNPRKASDWTDLTADEAMSPHWREILKSKQPSLENPIQVAFDLGMRASDWTALSLCEAMRLTAESAPAYLDSFLDTLARHGVQVSPSSDQASQQAYEELVTLALAKGVGEQGLQALVRMKADFLTGSGPVRSTCLMYLLSSPIAAKGPSMLKQMESLLSAAELRHSVISSPSSASPLLPSSLSEDAGSKTAKSGREKLLSSVNLEGANSLHFAARGLHADVFDSLIKAGLSIQSKDYQGATLLHWAAKKYGQRSQKNLIEVLQALAAHSFNFLEKNHKGLTALEALLAKAPKEVILSAFEHQPALLDAINGQGKNLSELFISNHRSDPLIVAGFEKLVMRHTLDQAAPAQVTAPAKKQRL